MIDDVYVFLAHYGVKGMHWGQRTAQKTVSGIIKVNNAAENVHQKIVNSKINQAGLKADKKIRETASTVSRTNKELGVKADNAVRSIKNKYGKLNNVQKLGLSLSGAAAAAIAVKGAGVVKEYGPAIIGSAKLLSDIKRAKGLHIANAITKEIGDVPYAKIVKTVYQVSSLK